MNAKWSPEVEYNRTPKERVCHLRDDVIAKNDFSNFSSLVVEFSEDSSQKSRSKYLDYSRHVAVAARRALALNLDKQQPLNVLDIGTGTGYFPLTCRHLGHKVMTIDYLTEGVYQRLIRHFDIPQIDCGIMPFQKLPDLGERFDVVTAFAIAFSKRQDTGIIWGPKEWDFLMDDLRANLMNSGGVLWLWLNPMFPFGARYDDALRDFFLKKGATVSDQHVVWQPDAVTNDPAIF
jgi:hypothetical protein